MDATRRFLESLTLPPGDLHALPDSAKRFPDGAQYCVSQGSGVMLMTDDEIRAMARLARSHQVEVSLFARPNAAWDTGAMASASAGKSIGPRLRGQDQLVYCLEDVKRAASLGIRSVLLADEGALRVAGEMRQQRGHAPAFADFRLEPAQVVRLRLGCERRQADPAALLVKDAYLGGELWHSLVKRRQRVDHLLAQGGDKLLCLFRLP